MEKTAVPNADIKKMLKTEFETYAVTYKHGVFYLERGISHINLILQFHAKTNILLSYVYACRGLLEPANIINNDGLFTPSGVFRFLLNDYELRLKAKLYKDLAELTHLVINEVSFYDELMEFYMQEYVSKLPAEVQNSTSFKVNK